jgi:hypothetical protein
MDGWIDRLILISCARFAQRLTKLRIIQPVRRINCPKTLSGSFPALTIFYLNCQWLLSIDLEEEISLNLHMIEHRSNTYPNLVAMKQSTLSWYGFQIVLNSSASNPNSSGSTICNSRSHFVLVLSSISCHVFWRKVSG